MYSILGKWAWLDNMPQAFLDEVRHQSLRSLLVLHQNVVRRRDLVALKAIQQCNANHGRWKGEKKAMIIITKEVPAPHVKGDWITLKGLMCKN